MLVGVNTSDHMCVLARGDMSSEEPMALDMSNSAPPWYELIAGDAS